MAEDTDVTVPSLHSVDFNYADSCDVKGEECARHLSQYFRDMCLSEDDCVTIEKNTHGQANHQLPLVMQLRPFLDIHHFIMMV